MTNAGVRLRKWLLPERHSGFGILIIVPVVLYFMVFRVGPILAAVYVSLHEWNLVSPMHWVGTANYRAALSDPLFLASMQRSLVYAALVIVVTLPLAFALAIVFNRSFRMRTFFRSAYFLPTVLSWLVLAIIWRTIYNPTFGLVSYVGDILDIPVPAVLADARLAMYGIILMGIWQALGFYMIVFLSALQSVPSEVYEAGAIDGTSSWSTVRYITLPLMRPAILFALVLLTIEALQVFPQVYVMTRGGPANATLVGVYYIYRQGFYIQAMGYASALAIILFAVLLVINFVYLRWLRTASF